MNEEIIIEFSGTHNLTLHGKILSYNSDKRNTKWVFQLFNDNSNKEVSIPESSFENKNITMKVKTLGTDRNYSIWSIDAVKAENDIFVLTTYPNAYELTLHLSKTKSTSFSD